MMVSMKKRKNKSQGDKAWDQAGRVLGCSLQGCP